MSFQKMSQSFIKKSLISILVAITCLGLSAWVMAQDVVIKVVDEDGDSEINLAESQIFIELENVPDPVYPPGDPPYNPDDIEGIKSIQLVLMYVPSELEIKTTGEVYDDGTPVPEVEVWGATAINELPPWPVYAKIVVDEVTGEPVGELNIDLSINPADPAIFNSVWYDPPTIDTDGDGEPDEWDPPFPSPDPPWYNPDGIYALGGSESSFILKIGAECLTEEGTPVGIALLQDRETGEDLPILNEGDIPIGDMVGGTVICPSDERPILRIHPKSLAPDIVCFSPGSQGKLDVWVDTMGFGIIGCSVHLTVTHNPDDGTSKVLEFNDKPFELGSFINVDSGAGETMLEMDNKITRGTLEDQLSYNGVVLNAADSDTGQGVLLQIPYTVNDVGDQSSVTFEFDFDAGTDRETFLIDSATNEISVDVLDLAAEYCVREQLKIYITSLSLESYVPDCASIDFSICQNGNVIFEESKVVQFPVDNTEENRVELILDPDDIQADQTAYVIAKKWHNLATAREVLIQDGLEVELDEAKGGDTDNDNDVDFRGDVLALIRLYDKCHQRSCDYVQGPDAPGPGHPDEDPWKADFNQNGCVGFRDDVLMIIRNYGSEGFSCGDIPGAPSVAYTEGSNSNAVFQLLVNGVSSKISRLSIGEEFNVSILAQDVSNLCGYAFTVDYDANGLTLLKSTEMAATEGTFLRTRNNHSLFFTTEENSGLYQKVAVVGGVMGNSDGVTGNGVVATLRFRVTSETPGTISLSNVEVADANYGYNLLPHQQLIVQPAPKTTVALQNYPNPFNPETWIPFHLANDAQVTIDIYDLSGRLIKKIDLGQKAAGYYVNQSQAAYWSGRNRYGEFVSSGVYFYTVRAGDYTATRKMLVLK
jgi:hypothetical protein